TSFISSLGIVCSVCRCSLQAIKPPPLPPRLFFLFFLFILNIHLQHLQLTAFSGLLDQFPSAAITPTLLLPVRVVFSVHLRGRVVGKSVEDPSSPLLLLRRDIGQEKLLVLSRHVHCSNSSSFLPSRIAELKAIIDNPETSDEQKINVQVAIDLYGGKMQPIPRVCIQGGQVINLQRLDFSRPFWMEVLSLYHSPKLVYPLFSAYPFSIQGYLQQLSAQTAIPATEPASSSTPAEAVPETVSSASAAVQH
ncbi:hypothetical protein TRV_06705, partial [Trichophyton verrucosum HKI 0517]